MANAAEPNAGSAAAAASAPGMLVQVTTDGVPKLHCPVCNKALVSLNGYVKHVKKHEAPGGFLCRYCDGRFCTDEELKRHRDAAHTTIACRICKDSLVTFGTETEYRDHIRLVHNGIDRVMFCCEKCGAEYKTLEPFRRHMETQCGTNKPYTCDQCSMSFVTKYNLKQHKESHGGERKFCCSYCGKDFLQKGRLVEHERSHTGEKPYKCDVCGKCFAHRESIVTHSSIHTGIRLVECKCCHSRFSCYSNLIKHRRTRPDTCGQAEFDPPRNRVRPHRSRIPPTLNPTSEIKVCNFNKIIKPGEQPIRKAPKKEHNNNNNERSTAASAATTTGAQGRNRGQRRRSSKTSDSVDEDDEGDTEEGVATDASETPPKRATRSSYRSDAKAHGNIGVFTFNGDSLEGEDDEEEEEQDDSAEDNTDFPDFEPIEYGQAPQNEAAPDHCQLPPPIKVEKPELSEAVEGGEGGATLVQPTAVLVEYPGSQFEYMKTNDFEDATLPLYSVKSEADHDPPEGGGEHSIFSDKDKLLDCLLNDANPLDASFTASDLVKVEEEMQMLEETEVILIKPEQEESLSQELEDVLALGVETRTNGPKTKRSRRHQHNQQSKNDDDDEEGEEEDGASVKWSPAGDSSEHALLSLRRTQRRRRRGATDKRSGGTSSSPKRTSKLTQQELKERLKMLKKEESSWHCPYCIKIYHMRKPYEKHLREDHQRPEQEIRDHFKSEHLGAIDEDIFKCQICEKIYLVEKRLHAHVKLHGANGDLVYKCPCYCSIYFATKEAATAHAQKEHRSLLYCDICCKFMTGHDSLKNHVRNHHVDRTGRRNQKRNFVCDKCGKKFSGRTSLTDHVRSDCGRVPLYACNICGKHLTTAGILKTHMLLHKDETPFQCEQCGKTFKVKAQYKTHIKTRHSDARPFKCHLCPKSYPYRESLLTHMTVHTGIKRFLCNGCGKRFTCISNLQAHRKVHADTCGTLPLNAKATQYMGVQKGNLLLGAKPEAGLDYNETNTLIAKDVLNRDLPMAQDLNYPSEPSAPLATVPLNYVPPMAGVGVMPHAYH